MNTVELQHKLNILQRQGPIYYPRCIRQKLLYEIVAFCLYLCIKDLAVILFSTNMYKACFDNPSDFRLDEGGVGDKGGGALN